MRRSAPAEDTASISSHTGPGRSSRILFQTYAHRDQAQQQHDANKTHDDAPDHQAFPHHDHAHAHTQSQSAFIRLLQQQELGEIRVTELCQMAEVNRTTFYANYADIYDLADAVQRQLEEDVLGLYREELEQGRGNHDFLRLFRHIQENPLFYKTYFKLNTDGKFRFVGYDVSAALARFDNRHIEYHIAFFGNGLNAVIKKWLQNDCRESPEEILAIISEEYQGIQWS